MSVKVIKEEGLSREFEITVAASEFKAATDKKLKQVAKQIKVPGFRPGKVPLKIVKEKHGVQLMGEVLENLVTESSKKVLDEKNLNPAMQPKIEISNDFDPTKEEQDLIYNISFEIYPDVPEVDFKKLEGEKLSVEVSDKDIEEGIQKIADNQKDFGPLKRSRKARKGDAVKIDFVGKIDGKEFEGGAGTDFQLELGSGQFIPGFEEQLIGTKKEEDVLVKVSFPNDYGAKEFAGKEAEFDVKVHEVLEAKETEINEEFAKKLGLENLEKLKEVVKSQIENDFKSVIRTKLKKDIFDYLDENCKFEVPSSMVEMEFKSIIESFKKKEDKDVTKEQESEFKTIAERRVRLGVILAELGRTNSIAVTNDELQKEVLNIAQNYPQQAQQVFEYYSKNKQAIEGLKGPILEEKVVDFITENSSLKEVSKTIEELLEIQKDLEDDSE